VKSLKAVEAVASERSELYQLWKDADPDHFAARKATIADLTKRLA